jgi:Zn-dependent M28 family amino/carboxypeptidase
MSPVEWTPRTRTAAGLVALLSLAALTVLSLWIVAPPAARDAQAPAGEFSAARAYEHVQRIGSQVHVAGSDAATDVREYIADTLRRAGLQTEVQDAIGAENALGGFQMARVRNVVALLPGADSTGRVILVAHYDSVQVSYGANDDGAGVSTLLETARALAAGPKPRNDIVFVFTDAEEACLCGAEAFVSQHRYAADGGVALNFESSGSSGPVITFETSAGNADVIGVYARSVPHPVATSFAVEVYRLLSYDTDFTPFLEHYGFTGLNAAYIDGSATYHTPEDRPSYMDTDSLQNHGDNAFALARAFGGEDLVALSQPSAGDSTYFPVFGLLVRYPGWLVWPLAVLALLAVAGFGYLARRRGLLTWPRAAAGFGLALLPILLAPVLTQVLWYLVTLVRPDYREMLDPWRPGWFRLGVVALVVTVLLGWYGLLRRRFGGWTLAFGALTWMALLGGLFAALVPGGSYLVALPALAGAVAATVTLLASRPWLRLLAVTLGAAVAVLILAPTVQMFFPALGMETAGATAFFAILLGLALLPVLEYVYPPHPSIPMQKSPSTVESLYPASTVDVSARRVVVVAGHRRWAATPAVLVGVLVLVFVGVGLAVDRFDAVHPTRTQLMYALDLDTGQARWLSGETRPSAWTSQYVNGVEDVHQAFPILTSPSRPALNTGPADVAPLAAPDLTVVGDTTVDGQRSLSLLVEPQRPVRLVYLAVESDAKVVKAVVAGREIPVDPGAVFALLFHAPPPDGLSVRLTLDGTAPVKVRVMDGSDGLDNLPGFKPRPPGIGVEGSHDSELVVVAKTYPL